MAGCALTGTRGSVGDGVHLQIGCRNGGRPGASRLPRAFLTYGDRPWACLLCQFPANPARESFRPGAERPDPSSGDVHSCTAIAEAIDIGSFGHPASRPRGPGLGNRCLQFREPLVDLPQELRASGVRRSSDKKRIGGRRVSLPGESLRGNPPDAPGSRPTNRQSCATADEPLQLRNCMDCGHSSTSLRQE